VLLWALAGAAAADDAAATKAPVAAPDSRATVTTVVAGIVSYTRWPAETRSIRLCTVGRGPGVDELLAAADLGSTQQSVPVQAAGRAASALNECDAIYVGALAINTSRNLLQSMVGRPVLLIGEGQEFCTDGGMFCLQPGASEVGFAVNLDAVARSGLRVNPRVLRMARNATGSGP
jgi:YfiR/HmsC-like